MMRWLLLLFLLQCPILSAWSAELSPQDYRARLEQLAAAIDADQLPAATALSADLATQHVTWDGTVLPTDPRIHAALIAGQPGTARHRISQVLDTVDAMPHHAAAIVDQAALAAIAKRQQAAQLAAGGTLGELNLHQPEQLKPLAERIHDAWEWLGSLWRDFWDWVRWLFGSDPHQTKAEGGSSTTTWVAIGLGVILLLVIVLALRRSPPPRVESTTAPLPLDAATDQDPRSRAADEWIRHARALAAEGRQREAVRAWYHALLVTCWARGHLHHRTGRTNWEYAVTLAAALPWSGRFRDLTARFDRTWYGGQEDATYAADAEAILMGISSRQLPGESP